MIDQVIAHDAETISPSVKRLTPQELERISQPFYEESRAELSEYWKKRFEERRKKPDSPK